MVLYKSRREYEAEAESRGLAWDMFDDRKSRVTNWWHKDCLNADGDLNWPAGTECPNLPTHMDSAMRRARRGLLPYPPSETCMCEWCTARRGTQARPTYRQLLEHLPVAEVPLEASVAVIEEPLSDEVIEEAIRDVREELAELQVTRSPVVPKKPPFPCTELGCDWVGKRGSDAQQRMWLAAHLKKHIPGSKYNFQAKEE